MTHTHTLTRTYTQLPLCHGHTLFIVTDTHHHIDRGLYTYMTSYLDQDYQLSILIDKPTLFINSWLIRLWVDNVLLINTRRLSIVIDKTIPLSIGISTIQSANETDQYTSFLTKDVAECFAGVWYIWKVKCIHQTVHDTECVKRQELVQQKSSLFDCLGGWHWHPYWHHLWPVLFPDLFGQLWDQPPTEVLVGILMVWQPLPPSHLPPLSNSLLSFPLMFPRLNLFVP